MKLDVGHLALVAAAVHLVVRLMKAGKLNDYIPPRYRPLLALWLGAGAGAIDAFVVGTPWQQAALTALLAVATATLGHDVFIESLRGGKELLQ